MDQESVKKVIRQQQIPQGKWQFSGGKGLTKVSGMDEKALEKLKDLITI